MKLFEKTHIGNMTLRNRLCLCPMGKPGDADGSQTDVAIRFYEERAKGGVGLIFTGVSRVGDFLEPRAGNMITSKVHVNKLYTLTESCHAYGAKVCIQIQSGMGRMGYIDPFNPPYAASAIPSFHFKNMMCRPLSKEQIDELHKLIGVGAGLAKSAGADAIEYILGGGYLDDNFATECWNTRTDEYGGSLENRMRFTLESIAAIRKAIGPNTPIIIKYTPAHFTPTGRTLEEGLVIAKMLEDAGVDALHVDLGNYENFNYMVPTEYDKVGLNLEVCAKLKEVVSIPVMAAGKLADPELMEKAIEEGKADFVFMGRQLIADPQWPNKVKEGRFEDVRPCIRCSECFRTRFAGGEAQCAINPLANNEDRFQLGCPLPDKKVLIIGGGPGGMYAAVAAADRKCKVELVEKTGELGGKVLAASAPEFKKEMRDYIEYLKREIAKRDITVKLNTEIKPEDVPADAYDKIIVAIGSEVICPPIPGLDKCGYAKEYLLGQKTAGKNVVVVGGGLVGSETAAHLKNDDNAVTILEMSPVFLPGGTEAMNIKPGLLKLLKDNQVSLLLGAKVLPITEDSVTYVMDGKEVTIPADTVINATGYKSFGEKYADALEGKCKNIAVIGDANSTRKVFFATREAHQAIRTME